MLKNLSTLDAVFITLMAACGLALKPVIGPLSKLIGSFFFMPGGSFAGAIYMLWPMLALLVARSFGAATVVGFLQGAVVLVTGIYGSHGILSLITYTLPCIIIDTSYFLLKPVNKHLSLFVPPALGNMASAAIVSYFFMHLPAIPLVVALIPAFIFGGIGGLIAQKFYDLLIVSFPQFGK